MTTFQTVFLVAIILAWSGWGVFFWRMIQNWRATEAKLPYDKTKRIVIIHLSAKWRWLPEEDRGKSGNLYSKAWLCWTWYRQEWK